MDEPIRIAQIMGKLWAGGVEMVVFNYYRAIDKKKVQFDFYYDADSTVDPPDDIVKMGAKFIKIPPYQDLFNYLKVLEKHFIENKYIIVHSHINTLSLFPLFAAWKCNIPVRIAHNHSVPCGESFRRKSLKCFLSCFAKVFPTDYFACSEKAGKWLFGKKNFNDGRVLVIKNAVDFDRFRPNKKVIDSLKKSLDIEKKLVIGHVGRFTFAKNHKYLIDIFKKISEIRKDSVLLLVGDGEMNVQIHQWVEENDLADKVIFVGKVTNPEYYYRLADVIVLPSIFEGLSLATIESQIAGTPVVVSTAIPKEAIISDGCLRLSLKEDKWVDSILEYAERKVILDDRSKAYDIRKASKLLEEWYIRKAEEKNNA